MYQNTVNIGGRLVDDVKVISGITKNSDLVTMTVATGRDKYVQYHNVTRLVKKDSFVNAIPLFKKGQPVFVQGTYIMRHNESNGKRYTNHTIDCSFGGNISLVGMNMDVNEINVSGNLAESAAVKQLEKGDILFITLILNVPTGKGNETKAISMRFKKFGNKGQFDKQMPYLKKGCGVRLSGEIHYSSNESNGVTYYNATINGDYSRVVISDLPKELRNPAPQSAPQETPQDTPQSNASQTPPSLSNDPAFNSYASAQEGFDDDFDWGDFEDQMRQAGM